MENWTGAGAKTQHTALCPSPQYAAEIDQIDQGGWNNLLQQFDDANILQTWAYGSVRWGRNNLSHLVLRKDGEIVSAAQLVIKKVPWLGAGIAYVKWGPLWQPRGTRKDPEILRQALRELHRVYANDRGLLLRIFSPDTEDGTRALPRLFEEEGFRRDPRVSISRTAVIDLSYSLQELRSSLKPTWRRNLVLAERQDLGIIEGTDSRLFDILAKLYGEMLKSKGRISTISASRYAEIQRDLPEALKMKVMLCELRGEPIAGIAVPCFGTTALNVISASAAKGLELRASYLLQWQMMQRLKEHGCRWYDLDLIDPRNHPGITQFKCGLAGKLGLTPDYIGRFEICQRPLSRVLVKSGSRFHTAYKRLKRRAKRLRHSLATKGP
jgi:lipid II:glycine glycyltransferase (peptidoglycan interpeptide bridge formation enzyme)